MYEALHSFLLAHIFGIYMLVMAIILLSRVQFYRNLIQNLQPQSGAIFVGASFGMALGLSLVVVHNLWVMEPRVIITILSWIILVKSILWLAFPECMLNCTKRLYAGVGYYVAVAVLAVLGAFLMTRGFYFFNV